MEGPTIELPTDLDSCHSLIRELLATLRQQGLLIGNMQHQLERLLRHRYGRSSETIDPDQLLLFAAHILAEAGATPASQPQPGPEADAPPIPAPAAKPKRKGHGRKPLPAHLERRRVLHELPPVALTCPECGGCRQAFGEEIREQLDYIPASLIVIQHVRPKYACQACQAHVVIADRLPEPIEKGLPGPGLLAHVIVSKYADHLPLYRQERMLAREGVAISRQTMCGWMARCAELLKPIYDAMVKAVLQSKVIQTDDTPVDVLDPGREGTLQGRIWIAIGDRGHPYSVYDFTPSRAGDGPARFFRGYAGYLQADAYSGYDALFEDGDVIEVGCWAHARRKFYEARTTDPRHSHVALAYIRRLYIVESDAKEAKLDDDARRACVRNGRCRSWRSCSRGSRGSAPGAAQEPDGRGDRLCAEPQDGAAAVHGAGIPGDRQQCVGAWGEDDRPGPEELAVFRQRGGRGDRGDPVQLDGDVPASGSGALGVLAGCAGSGEHAPGEPDRRAAARPLGGDPSSSRRNDTGPGSGCVRRAGGPLTDPGA